MSSATEEPDLQPVRVDESDSGICICLAGNVGIGAGAELAEAARRAAVSGKPVRLEWSQADYIHLSALQVVLALKAELAAGGRKLKTGELSPAAQQLVASAGLSQLFGNP